MEQTESSETLAYKIQTPGNYPEDSMQHSEHVGSVKSRILNLMFSIHIPNFFFLLALQPPMGIVFYSGL